MFHPVLKSEFLSWLLSSGSSEELWVELDEHQQWSQLNKAAKSAWSSFCWQLPAVQLSWSVSVRGARPQALCNLDHSQWLERKTVTEWFVGPAQLQTNKWSLAWLGGPPLHSAMFLLCLDILLKRPHYKAGSGGTQVREGECRFEELDRHIKVDGKCAAPTPL